MNRRCSQWRFFYISFGNKRLISRTEIVSSFRNIFIHVASQISNPMKNTLRLFSSLILFQTCALLSTARIVHVSTYSSLLTACQYALAQDTIIIASGTYTIIGASRIMITNRPGPILVSGTTGNPANVIIEGQGQDNPNVQMVFNLDNSPQWTFQNLTVRKSYYHGFKFDHNSTDCVLRNVVMRDHGESGVKGTSDPATGQYPDRLLIEDCDIGFTNTNGGTRSVVEGVDGVGVNDWIIRRSRFLNIQKSGNPAYAIFTKGNSSNTIIEQCSFFNCFIAASFGGGGTAPQYFRNNDTQYEHRNGIIRNNVMIRTSDAGVYINKGKECKIYNNTLFECILTIQLRFVETSGYVRNNLVKISPNNANEPIIRLRDGATMLANQANMVGINSYFVQPIGADAQLDLHLKSNTAPVNAGVDVAPDVTNDFDGYARPFGAAYDIGAFEFGAIPVELSSFTATVHYEGILLQWQTDSETNNAGFFIERNDAFTSQGEHPEAWRNVGFVTGNGTTKSIAQYKFLDSIRRDTPQNIFSVRYRLKQVDFDGSSEYSRTIQLDFLLPDMASIKVNNYPNPFSDRTLVRLTGASFQLDASNPVFMYSSDGKLIDSFSFSVQRNTMEVYIRNPDLRSGKYFLLLRTTSGFVIQPLTVLRR